MGTERPLSVSADFAHLRAPTPPRSGPTQAALAAFLPLDPATRTATGTPAATADPNVNHTTAPPARATAGAKIASATGATARTPSSLRGDDDARTAASTTASAAAPTAPSSTAATLGRSSGTHDQGKAKQTSKEHRPAHLCDLHHSDLWHSCSNDLLRCYRAAARLATENAETQR